MKDCNEHQQSKFYATFKIVAEKGHMLNDKVYRYPLKDCGNVGEFKTFKKRLYFYRDGGDLVITHGATKKDDETDPREVKRVNRVKEEIEQEKRRIEEQMQSRSAKPSSAGGGKGK